MHGILVHGYMAVLGAVEDVSDNIEQAFRCPREGFIVNVPHYVAATGRQCCDYIYFSNAAAGARAKREAFEDATVFL